MNSISSWLSGKARDRVITDSFKFTQHKLEEYKKIDSNFSGATCVSVFIQKNILVCANVGDSRAIVGV